jgi:autotransporter-associated beta strand protein
MSRFCPLAVRRSVATPAAGRVTVVTVSSKALAAVAVAAGLAMQAHDASAQTAFFWNGGNITANPANGGTGNWDTANAWRTVTSSGAQGTWAAGAGGTNDGTLAGTAGAVTLGTSGGTNFTGRNLTVSTSGYSIRSTSSGRNLVMTGTLTLGANVALTINQDNTNAVWGFGAMNFGTGASLVLQGNASANNANRISLSAASGTSSGGSITLSGTGAGPTGFVGTASGVALNMNITNSSTSSSATMLGASSGNSLNFGGVLSGTSALQISAGQSGGAGITIFSSTNSYGGDTYLNQATNGVFRMGIANALPATTTVFFGESANGGTKDVGGAIDLNGFSLAVGALSGTAGVRGIANNTTTPAVLTIGKATGSTTFSGTIGIVGNTNLTTQTNLISVVKTGSSTQILAGLNTYTGTTTVSGGILQAGGTGAFGDAAGVVTVSGGTLSLGNFAITKGTVSVSGGSITSGTLTGTSYALTGSGSVGAVLAGAAGLTKTGAGTAILTATNTYSGGSTIQAGVLTLGNTAALGSASGSLTADGGTLNLAGFSTSVGTLSGSAGEITSAGAATLTAASNATATYGGAFTGAVSFVKNGTGLLTLTGSSSSSGSTTVNTGTLAVNGVLGSGSLSVAAAAWLQGTGTIGGAANVLGTLSPGNSPGILTLGGATLGPASNALIEISGTDRGVTYDGVNITTASSLTYGGTLSFSFGSLIGNGSTLDIFNFGGLSSGGYSSVVSTGSYAGVWENLGSGTFQFDNGSQTLTFSQATGDIIVVPEPATIAFAGAGLALAASWARRRRRRASKVA